VNAEKVKTESEEKEVKKEKVREVVPVDPKLEQAFRYFDFHKSGYIRDTDFYAVIHSLSLGFSHKHLMQLKHSAWGSDRNLSYKQIVQIKK